jgi:hypothetical protein
VFGIAGGTFVRITIIPPKNPEPFTKDDALVLTKLSQEIDSLELVQKLRAASLAYEGKLTGPFTENATDFDEVGAGWRELIVDSVAEVEPIINSAALTTLEANESRIPNPSSTTTSRTFTRKSVAGARGLGVQRVFWNSISREIIAVVWFGAGACGWPGITHGGIIGTVLSDAMARVIAGPDTPLG